MKYAKCDFHIYNIDSKNNNKNIKELKHWMIKNYNIV
jgi:hypothetical protein